MSTLRRHLNRLRQRRNRGQALVELALVMPVLAGIVFVLFQFGILFISYLSLVHMGRDVGRWLAVNPDKLDSEVLTYINSNRPVVLNATGVRLTTIDPLTTNTTQRDQLNSDQNSNPGALWVFMDHDCPSKTGDGRCADRTTGTYQVLTLEYDARAMFFLPTDWRLGPFMRMTLPSRLPAYKYTTMVEPH